MHRSASAVVLLASSLLCLLSSARSQSPVPAAGTPTEPLSKLSGEALRRLDRDDLGTNPIVTNVYAMAASMAPPEQAIPALERFYAKHKDDPVVPGATPLRDVIASLLVQIGDSNHVYWNVLVPEADAVLSSPVPVPSSVKAGPFELDKVYTAEQKAWANANNMSLLQMYSEIVSAQPARFAPLAATGDPRSLPILRTALKSKNPMIQGQATLGLAILRDKDSIPTIVAICREDPSLADFLINGLLDFHDPAADKAFRQLFPDRDLEQARQNAVTDEDPYIQMIHRPPQDLATPEPPRSESSAPDSSPAPPPQTHLNPDTVPAPASESTAGSPAGVIPSHS